MSTEKKLTELERMEQGMLFNQTALPILLKMSRGYYYLRKLNKTSLNNQPRRNRLIKKLFGSIGGDPFYVQSPVYVDYGHNVHVGKNFMSNYNVVFMDEGEIRMGDDVFIGPNCVITTNFHPVYAEERKICQVPNRFPKNYKGVKVYAKPIQIGNNVWIGSSTTVCGGVTIGDNTVIGAGSVVTRDIPANVFACGVPCRVVRAITEEDRLSKDIKG